VDDAQIHESIEELVAEEHELWQREAVRDPTLPGSDPPGWWGVTSSNRDPSGRPPPFSGLTAWSRGVRTPLQEFLRTETGGAAVLLAAAVAALAWVNLHASSYESLWGTTLSIEVGGAGVSLPLREWVNSGLMTFFFFVLGLEARREFDLGELRERRRFALPLLAAIGGMAAAVTIYLLFNAGGSSARGWGIAMSTDTAFALGLLALVGPRFPDRLRAFMLTAVVFDDLVALVVIATVYTETLRVLALSNQGRGRRTGLDELLMRHGESIEGVTSPYYAEAFSPLPGRCFRLVTRPGGEGGPVHCPEPTWRGSWRAPNGRRYRVAACEGHRPPAASAAKKRADG
jgi:hypothetical protein